MTEVDDRRMAFTFQLEKENEQIMDMSPWSVQGHCLNLKQCKENISIGEAQLHRMQMWIQIYGLRLKMHNRENAYNIGNSIGKCISVEKEGIARRMTFLRLLIEKDVTTPLTHGFCWTSKPGEEKWTTIKYERLSDVCYGCGMLGHTSLNLCETVAMSEIRPKFPMFGLWLAGSWPQNYNMLFNIGGEERHKPPQRDKDRQSWRDVMQNVSGQDITKSSKGRTRQTNSARQQWLGNQVARSVDQTYESNSVTQKIVHTQGQSYQ